MGAFCLFLFYPYERDYTLVQHFDFKSWLKLDQMCEWTSEILCVHLMDGACFIKMHAFSWKILDTVKEVLSLNFEPTIKSRVVTHLKSCLLDICFSEMVLISPLQILMTDILSVTERSYEWNPWQIHGKTTLYKLGVHHAPHKGFWGLWGFFFPIVWGRWIDNHSQVDLANFGFRLERKVNLFGTLLYLATCYITHCLKLVIFIKKKSWEYGDFGPFFLL